MTEVLVKIQAGRPRASRNGTNLRHSYEDNAKLMEGIYKTACSDDAKPSQYVGPLVRVCCSMSIER